MTLPEQQSPSQQPPLTVYTVGDFIEWNDSGQLELTPKFQRRPVWPPKAQSYFVDTVLRGAPCPPLFVRLRIDIASRRSIREVVDGQQRLRTVLGYLRGDFPVLAAHNTEYGGQLFSDLPESAQRAFYAYRFAVHLLQDVSDASVLDLFARLNTNTVKLNSQELRNALYFGVFKQTVYDLALKHYAFWTNNKIFGDRQIARMGEAELVSELLITLLEGFRSTRASDLDAFYKRYDDEFPEAAELSARFREVMNLIGALFESERVYAVFRRRALFFTLFCAIYDLMYGLPGFRSRGVGQVRAQRLERIRTALVAFAAATEAPDPPEHFRPFREAARSSTTDPARRRLRHEFLWSEVFAANA